MATVYIENIYMYVVEYGKQAHHSDVVYCYILQILHSVFSTQYQVKYIIKYTISNFDPFEDPLQQMYISQNPIIMVTRELRIIKI